MTLIPLAYYGNAAGFAATVIIVAWTIEALVGRQLGFWPNVAAILIVIVGCIYYSHRELTECLLVRMPSFPKCEWSVPFLWLVLAMTGTIVPLLTVSAIMLRRWSRRPISPA